MTRGNIACPPYSPDKQWTCPRGSAARDARIMRSACPSKDARAQGRPGADWHLRPPCEKNARGRNHRLSRSIRPSLRDGLHPYRQSPWCAGLLATMSHDALRRVMLDTSFGVSGPCHFRSVPSALVKRLRSRPSRPTSRIVTTRTPLSRRQVGQRRTRFRKNSNENVVGMAGLVPAIHALNAWREVDARDEVRA